MNEEEIREVLRARPKYTSEKGEHLDERIKTMIADHFAGEEADTITHMLGHVCSYKEYQGASYSVAQELVKAAIVAQEDARVAAFQCALGVTEWEAIELSKVAGTGAGWPIEPESRLLRIKEQEQ